jgi:aerotaxis receptor
VRHTISEVRLRTNLPVTQREVMVGEGETLLSTTDLKGRILYANDAFIRISGFEQAELYGKAHNVVRHPDMPEEAFADMWRTLQDERPWSALVKNRRKDGDHYWVRANATPVRAHGRVVGYLSVRTRATPDDIRACESAYRRIRDGRTAALLFRGGFIVRRGLSGAWQRFWRFLPLGARVQGAVLACTAAGVAATLVAMQSGAIAPALLIMATASAATALWLHTGIVSPLLAVTQQAHEVASGQPSGTRHRQRGDEIGALARSVEQAGLNVVSLVDDMREKGQGVQRAAEELSQGNADLAVRTELAASSLQQSAAALEQLAATILSNRDTAHHATALAADATSVAARGALLVDKVVQEAEAISEASRRVGEIVGLIDAVAFQTNVLALNAAVEAARAGVHGRGFAVVASEVRTLSQRSAEAARDIRRLLEASQERVDSGRKAVAEAGDSMGEMTRSVESLAAMIRDISAASAEQATGVEEINTAVAQLDRMTQQNAALVQQSTAATEGLTLRARRLAEAVAAFDPAAREAAAAHASAQGDAEGRAFAA